MIKVLADKYLYNITHFCPNDVDLRLFDPDAPLNIADDIEALLIRTVTKINPQTFPHFPDSLKFIATGSAGTNHVDIPYLADHNITFADAAGCNARSVAEYVGVALLLWAEHKNINAKKYSIGIIGVGHTGGAVQKILHALGIKSIAYDPPRQRRDSSFTSASLDEVLQCDILTFHVPLTKEQPNATFHWLDSGKLKNNQFKLIINAARGGVIDEQALLAEYQNNQIGNYILDVWENEPNFNDDVARNAFLKTPHIAGYSKQAKSKASKMIMEALAVHFGIDGPKAPTGDLNIKQKKPLSDFWSLTDVLTYYHPIRDYETRLLMLVGRSSKEKIKGFNHIRTGHPLRNELRYIHLPSPLQSKFPMLKNLFV